MPDLGSTTCRISQPASRGAIGTACFSFATVTCAGEPAHGHHLVTITVDLARPGPVEVSHRSKQANDNHNNITSCHVQLIGTFSSKLDGPA